MMDYNCQGCGRLIYRGDLKPGTQVELKCRKCGELTVTIIPIDADSTIGSQLIPDGHGGWQEVLTAE